MKELTQGQVRYQQRLLDKPNFYIENYGEKIGIVPQRLWRARLEACYSLEELADLIPCNHMALSDGELDGRIGGELLKRVAEALGRPIEYFQEPWPVGLDVQIQGLPDWVREIRESMQISLREFEREFGVNYKQWNKWECGRKEPLPRSLRLIREIAPEAPWPPDGPK